LGVVAMVLRRTMVLVTVRGGSMRPTYEDGDVLVGLRWIPPRRGRVVVFTPPVGADPSDPPYRVKRVVAVAGDPAPTWVPGVGAGTVVPAGKLAVRGDAPGSEDSRQYGLVPASSLRATVIGRLRTRQSGP
jgi:signal peptidase I